MDNGGQTISAHEVWHETGGTSVQDTTYDGFSKTHTVPSLTSGSIYRISVRSKNVEGYSDYSEPLEIAATSLPDAPALIRKSTPLSTKNSISLEWDKSPDK